MKLPEITRTVFQESDRLSESLQAKAILFEPTLRFLEFAKDISASPDSLVTASAKPPFQYSYFSLKHLPSVYPDNSFIGALCSQVDEDSYLLNYLYTAENTTVWFPFTIRVSNGSVYLKEWPLDKDLKDPSILDLMQSYTGILLRSIAILNCRNLFIKIIDVEVPPALERKRRRKGKKPLFEHKILDIDFAQLSFRRKNESIDEQTMRAHLVRGHFKLRKTGLFWWSPFVRGNAKNGILTKDYSIDKGSNNE